jgi:RimJ/RimL family protein N-acetyltransferase
MRTGFKTGRTIGTPVRREDFDEMHTMHSDERVMATFGGVWSLEKSQRRFQEMLDHWEKHDFGVYVVRDRADGHFLGHAGLQVTNVGGPEEIEYVCVFVADSWRKGIATEVSFELVRVAFEDVGLPELVAFALPTNKGSIRVMEKTGFVYEKDVPHDDGIQVFYRQINPLAK